MDYAKKIKRKIKRENKKTKKNIKKNLKPYLSEKNRVDKINYRNAKKFCKECITHMYNNSLLRYEVDCPKNILLKDIEKILSRNLNYRKIRLNSTIIPYIGSIKLEFIID